jgi:cation diffusion facilitator family transporter
MEMAEITTNIHKYRHSHAFGQERVRMGERRTLTVIVITGVMMVAEITAGVVFGSMALLADGLHMASHATALGINAYAYVYARRHAHDERFSFGPGKVNALGGFTGAILLAVFAAVMGWESFMRILAPVEIAFNQAISVAFLGLAVNGTAVFILRTTHDDPSEDAGDEIHNHDHDHNLRSAYLHVLADALTSILAIVALFTAKYFDTLWMDPLMGIAGAILVSRWSLGLLRATANVLLDKQGPEHLQAMIKSRIEDNARDRIADFHLWSIGPNLYSLIIGVVTSDPKPAAYYKKLLPENMELAHVTVEVLQAPGAQPDRKAQ